MELITVNTKEEMARLAAEIIAKTVSEKPDAVLGLATGDTPVHTYSLLCEKCSEKLIDFSKIKTVNLDEYVGMGYNDKQSFKRFMFDNLFDKINIKHENIHIPDGKVADIALECENYDRLINSLGGIDLQLLGIGHDGHIGFNEPSTEFIYETHKVMLDPVTVKANSRFFKNENEVPRFAITMGISPIMNAGKLLMLAGKDKKEILMQAIFDGVTPSVPASVITKHKNLTVIYCNE